MSKIKRVLSLCMIVILLCAGVLCNTALTKAAAVESIGQESDLTIPEQEDIDAESDSSVQTQDDTDAGEQYPSATADYTPGIIVLEEPEVFSVEGDNVLIGSGQKETGIAPLGLLMDNITIKSVERINTFRNESSSPVITTSIKYIDDDGSYGDSRGEDGSIRWRYVYCIEHEKDPPLNKVLTWDNWENRYVNHIMYYGAMYYYETSRKASHSTGNWRYDYLATHMAICVATGQYTLAQVTSSIRKSPASSTDEELLITAITNMVNDAYAADGLTGWDSDGWFRMDSSYTSFKLTADSKTWTLGDDGYYYSGWITPLLTTIGDYYANADITSLTNTVTSGVSIEKKYTDSIHSPYRLKISKKQFATWQTTGKTIKSTVTIQVPSHWGAATYTSGDSSLQDVCLVSYSSINQYTSFSKSISFTIPKAIQFQLKKVRNGTSQVIPGAVFKVTKPDKTTELLTTDANGKFTIKNLEYGKYTIKEVTAPDGFQLNTKSIIFIVNTDDSVTINSKQSDSVSVEVNTKGNVEAVVQDEVAPYQVQVWKQNTQGIALEGVEFTLYEDEACSQVVDVQTTNSKGKLTFSNLVPETVYYLKETKALPGYRGSDKVVKLYAESDPLEEKFSFWMDDTLFSAENTSTEDSVYMGGTVSERVVNMKVVNEPEIQLPSSGSGMTLFWMISGVLLMSGTLFSKRCKSWCS